MKTIDALNILSIAEKEITQDQVKSAYRKACKTYHPDINPAGLAMMQAVNEAYESLMNDSFPIVVADSEVTTNYGEILNNALNAIINCVGITIEICGAWIWVSGETKTNKDILKSSGFIWSNQKEMWYFRPKSQKKRFYRGKSSIDEIRVKYGSEKINSRYRRALS
jgi:hypothetical protein